MTKVSNQDMLIRRVERIDLEAQSDSTLKRLYEDLSAYQYRFGRKHPNTKLVNAKILVRAVIERRQRMRSLLMENAYIAEDTRFKARREP